GLFPPYEIFGRGRETRNLDAPKRLREGFKTVEDNAHQPPEWMQAIRLVIVDEDQLASGSETVQQGVDQLVFAVVRKLVQQK
ncbi:hypothetical protein DF186_21935, partial [Enterococcus hirae]